MRGFSGSVGGERVDDARERERVSEGKGNLYRCYASKVLYNEIIYIENTKKRGKNPK